VKKEKEKKGWARRKKKNKCGKNETEQRIEKLY